MAALMARDNGEAGAEGQRPEQAFPKGFIGVLPSLLRGLRDRINPVCESGFQQGFDPLVECLEGSAAHNHLAIDEEGRGAVDLEHVDGELPVGRQLVHQGLILQAILDGLRTQSGLLADQLEGFRGFFHQPVLLAEHDVGDGEIFGGIAKGDSAKYFAVADIMFNQQDRLVEKTTETLKLIGKQAGLSSQAVEDCLKDQALMDRLTADRQYAIDVLKVDGTPTFFINGAMMVGEVQFDAFEKRIKSLLKT